MGRVRRLAEPNAGNPFIDSMEYTPWMRVKLALAIVLLLPIRILLTLLVLVPIMPLAMLASMGVRSGRHLRPWQQFIMRHPIPFLTRLWMMLFGYYTLPYRGQRASVAEAPITLIAPHSNVLDPFMLTVYAFGSPVSRRENKRIPILGTCIETCEPIWVDRVTPAASSADAAEPQGGNESSSRRPVGTVQAMRARLDSPGMWTPIVVFPEGTVHSARCVLGFKSGAFRPGAPVQVALFRYSRPMPGFWCHWTLKLPLVFLNIMCQWRNRIEVEYLPVYLPNEAEKKDASLYAANVQAVVAKALGYPSTDYGLEDLRLQQMAEELGMPQSTALVEYNLINRLFGARLPELKAILSRFARIDAGKRGVVSRDDFLSYLQWPVAEHAGLLFDEYDTCSDCGELRFREYAVATLDLAVKVPDGEGIAAAAFKALSGGEEHMSVDSVLDYMQQQQGYGDVTKDGVQSFLYRVSESNELTADGFAAYVDANPDVKVLVFWLMNGTEQF